MYGCIKLVHLGLRVKTVPELTPQNVQVFYLVNHEHFYENYLIVQHENFVYEHNRSFYS